FDLSRGEQAIHRGEQLPLIVALGILRGGEHLWRMVAGVLAIRDASALPAGGVEQIEKNIIGRSALVRTYAADRQQDRCRVRRRNRGDAQVRCTGRSSDAVDRGPAFFAYSNNYLIDVENAIIVDVQATTAIRQAEMTAAKR